MSLSAKIEQLNREIGTAVDRAVSDLRRQISERLRAGQEELQRRLEEVVPDLPASYLAEDDFALPYEEAATAARASAFADLREALAAIDRARSQAEILTSLLEHAGRFASRTAVLLLRPGEVRGWGGYGFGDAEAAIRSTVLDPSQDGPWAQIADSAGILHLAAGDCAELCRRIESSIPREGVLVPMVLRDRVAAVLYADCLDDRPLGVEAIQTLVYTAALAIETLPFRERASTPTLQPPGAPPAGGIEPAVAEPPTAETGAASTTATTAPSPAETAGAATATQPAAWESPVQEAPVEPAEPEIAELPEVEAEPLPAYPEDFAAAEEPVIGEEAGAPWSVEPLESEPEVAAPETRWSAEPVAEAPAPAPTPSFAEAAAESAVASPQETVLLPRLGGLRDTAAEAREPASVTPIRPAAPTRQHEDMRTTPVSPLSAGMPAGTSEVRPPGDIQGPGWAFATTRVPVSASDETLHEEARRLARLLVSEIKLYNEEQVEEGRRSRDVYERLKDDIDRSRQMYEERVDPRILRSTDYFYQELVRILAAGDARVLGI